jgi:cephalosporin hydroxylase
LPSLIESDKFEFPANFLGTVAHYAEQIKAQSRDCPHKRPAIIWGGASKGVVFALFIQRAGAHIDYVIDINPAKQGKYLAGTGLRVCSPSDVLEQVEQGSTIFVMNGNYLAEIKQMTHNQFNYLTVDHETFEQEVKDRIVANGENAQLRADALAFTKASLGPQYSYNFTWQGRPIIQYPQDMVAMQELIWQIKPDLIIETGIAHGGSLIFSASMLALLDICDAIETGSTLDPKNSQRKVLGIDIDIRAHNREAIEVHPMTYRIQMIQGSSIAPEIIEQVKQAASGYKRILVCLDSNHTHAHVLAELQAYAPLTSVDSYCVVFDTIVEDLPADMFPDRPWGPGDNPKTAVWEYLETHPEFEIDKSIQNKLLITVAPDGYLRRLK